MLLVSGIWTLISDGVAGSFQHSGDTNVYLSESDVKPTSSENSVVVVSLTTAEYDGFSQLWAYHDAATSQEYSFTIANTPIPIPTAAEIAEAVWRYTRG